MIKHKTLVEGFKSTADNPNKITYIESQDQEKSFNYAELYQRALGILNYLQKKNLKPGDELIILLNNNEQFIDVFWACILGRIVPVPLAFGAGDQHRLKVFKVFQKLNRPYVYTSRKIVTRLNQYAQNTNLNHLNEQFINKTLLVEDIDDISTAGEIADVSPDDIAFIQFSSGSTGDPKGVVLTHRNLMTNINAISDSCDHTPNDISISWMPLTHDMGIIGFHICPLIGNFDQYLMPTDLFVRRPLLWLMKLSEKRATFTSSPNFGYQHLLKHFNPEKLSDINLSSIRLIFNGAEPISAKLCDKFLKAMAPYHLSAKTMFPVYGMAEASLAVTFTKPSDEIQKIYIARDQLQIGQPIKTGQANDTNMLELIQLGTPVTDCQLKIVDSEFNSLTEDHLGHILIKGNNVTKGYYDDNELNQQIINKNGWLNTNDLGFIHQGQLVITGRSNDMIIIHGQNYYPHDIEQSISHIPATEYGKAAAVSIQTADDQTNKLAIFVAYKGSLEEFAKTATTIKKTVTEKLGLEARYIIPINRIPKTTSGKMQRYLLAEQFAQGEFQQVITELDKLTKANQPEQTAKNNIEQQLCNICNEHLDQTIGTNDNIFDLGTSSLALAQIYEQINEHYPNAIEVTDIFDYPTIEKLATYLETRI